MKTQFTFTTLALIGTVVSPALGGPGAPGSPPPATGILDSVLRPVSSSISFGLGEVRSSRSFRILGLAAWQSRKCLCQAFGGLKGSGDHGQVEG